MKGPWTVLGWAGPGLAGGAVDEGPGGTRKGKVLGAAPRPLTSQGPSAAHYVLGARAAGDQGCSALQGVQGVFPDSDVHFWFSN